MGIDKSEVTGVMASLKRAEIARNAKQFEENKADFDAEMVKTFEEKQAIREKTLKKLEGAEDMDAELMRESSDFFDQIDAIKEGDGKISKEEMLKSVKEGL